VRHHILIFTKEEAGSSTIEAVLRLPVFVASVCLIAGASFLFFGQNKACRIIRDANRTLSVGHLADTDEVEADALDKIGASSVVCEIDLGRSPPWCVSQARTWWPPACLPPLSISTEGFVPDGVVDVQSNNPTAAVPAGVSMWWGVWRRRYFQQLTSTVISAASAERS
jgi:hypothetical protein